MEDQEKSLPKISMPAIWLRMILFLVIWWTWYICWISQQTGVHRSLALLVIFAGFLLPDFDAPKSWKARYLEPVSLRYVGSLILLVAIFLLGLWLLGPYFSAKNFESYFSWWQGFLGGLLLWATVSLIRRTKKYHDHNCQKELTSPIGPS